MAKQTELMEKNMAAEIGKLQLAIKSREGLVVQDLNKRLSNVVALKDDQRFSEDQSMKSQQI